ncbi:MAG: FHA domain-containing protein, partial [Bdellovibrionota bacterium]
MFRLKLRLHGKNVSEIALESGREYTFGRGTTCDVQLEEQPGISRQHFKIFENEGEWTAQVIAKFGDLTYQGQPVQSLKIESGTVFKIAGYDFAIYEAEVSSEETSNEVFVDDSSEVAKEESDASEVVSMANLPVKYDAGRASFDGNDEATKIISISSGINFLRIVHADGSQDNIKLDSKKVVAGRDESNQVVLNDRKASRRQFEISATSQGVFIRDLGSSNGTILNGMPLAADELKILRSGDVIQVGQLTMHFEVRDPSFEKRLMVVPKEVLAPPVVVEPQYEMISYPVPTGPGGAVRISEQEVGYEDANQSSAAMAKKKKMRFYLIVAAVLLPVLALLTKTDPKETKKVDTATSLSPSAEAFSKLSPQKQQQVKETYILAKNLYVQGKQALSAEQLKKLHEMIPEGYENSLAIAEECRQIAEQAEAQRMAELALKEAEANRQIVDANLKLCEPLANATFDVIQLKACLAPTFERDPGNPRLSEFISRVELRLSERDQKAAMQKDYSDRVARGRRLHEEAVSFDKKGDAFAAMAAYKRHLGAGLPDPSGLKSISSKNLDAIQKNLGVSIDRALASAEAAYSTQNYKEAIVQVKRAKSFDPKNDRAAELNARITRELNLKLKEYYEE